MNIFVDFVALHVEDCKDSSVWKRGKCAIFRRLIETLLSTPFFNKVKYLSVL